MDPKELMHLLARESSSAGWIDEGRLEETHTAYVFLIGNSAYKLKKPVRLPYLDFTTPERRRVFLQEELRINRQLAGPIYKRVRSITRQADGSLQIDGSGEPIDWMLEMARLPENDFMDRRLAVQCIRSEEVGALGILLCSFYDKVERKRSGAGIYLRQLRKETLINREHLVSMRSHLQTQLSIPNLQLAAELIDRYADEIIARGEFGMIVDGHGDLRPEHVCLTIPPTLFDRLEFDADLRQIDIYDEVNYLALETEMGGAEWVGAELLKVIDQHFGARPSAGLMKAYGLFRLFLRARLAIGHLFEPFPRRPEKWIDQTRLYLMKANSLSEALF